MVFLRRFAVLGEFNTLLALLAPEVGRHGLVLEVTRDLGMIGLDGNRFANQPRRDGIGMPIKADGEIIMHLALGRITTIRYQLW